jgi:signal transduction histidine kinase
VRAALEFYGGGGFEFIETSRVERVAALVRARDIQVVVLARPELHEWNLVTAQMEMAPVVVIGAGNTKLSASELAKAGLQGYLPVDELYKLPSLLLRLMNRRNSDGKVGPDDVSFGDRRAIQSHLMDSRAVRESQKLISIGRLAAEIAHEINNPLESVGNLIYLAQCEPQMPERAGEYLRSAERELARVVQISKQTLSFHRESNEPTRLRVSDLMDEVVSLYNRRILEKQLNVTREYSVEQTITALPGEIRQVFSNLVTNAIEASCSGGTLRLRIREARKWAGIGNMKGLRITIADGGSGISEESRRRIGELFFTTKGQSGTGLGLWVTKSIIARYGGTLRLKSSTGEKHGTVFTLFLPFNDRATHADAQAKKPAALDSGRKARLVLGNVTEISRHPSHHDNQAHASATAHQGSAIQPGFTQKRNG